MSALSDALAAMDKATPGEWVARISTTDTPEGHTESAEVLARDNSYVRLVAILNKKERPRDNAILLAAAPDALAWIKKALPELESYRDKIQRERLSDSFSGSYRESVIQEERLDAMLAEAKGDNHAGH